MKPMIGMKFGKLTVVERAGLEKRIGAIKYRCLCDCGNYVVVAGRNLRSYITQSCGCLKNTARTRYANKIEGAYRVWYKAHEKRSKRWDDGNLDFNVWLTTVTADCIYCQAKPRMRLYSSTQTYVPWTGIDRVDNDRGYCVDNVVPCCTECNMKKHTMPVDIFLMWIKKEKA